jgi:hypothetical protein
MQSELHMNVIINVTYSVLLWYVMDFICFSRNSRWYLSLLFLHKQHTHLSSET